MYAGFLRMTPGPSRHRRRSGPVRCGLPPGVTKDSPAEAGGSILLGTISPKRDPVHVVCLAVEFDKEPLTGICEVRSADKAAAIVSNHVLRHGLRNPGAIDHQPESILERTLGLAIPPASILDNGTDSTDSPPPPSSDPSDERLNVIDCEELLVNAGLIGTLDVPTPNSTKVNDRSSGRGYGDSI